MKILILEDDADDALLLSGILRTHFNNCEIGLVSDRKEYLQALVEFAPDIILSDNFLTRFSASEALELLIQRNSIIPFILVTGTATDEFAAGIIKAGASDYILKDSMNRLPVAIEAALKQAQLERERLEMLEKLVESERKYRTIFWESPLPKIIYDIETLQILDVNRAAIDHYGYSREEFLNMVVLDLRPSHQQHLTIEMIRERQAKQDEGPIDWVHMKKNGEYIIVETRVHGIEYNNRMARMVIINDVTERVKAEEELRSIEAELLNQKIQEQKKVTRAVIKAQEGERNYIGLELHDNVNQLLVSAKMYLNMAIQKRPDLKGLVEYPIELINSSIQEIRSLAYGYVAPLSTVGLEELLRIMLDKIRENSTIQTMLDYHIESQLIEDDLKLNIYRIIQEQINNIVKHASANQVHVIVNDSENAINILVSDNGCGFDIMAKRNGIGISNMINRVESFNGEIQIDSAPGKGCRVVVRIPLSS
ncbi:MAG TPA: PAS domain S-box protein [Parasegetibacter sp.]